MILHEQSNVHPIDLDPSAVRNAALALTYYDRASHPETQDNLTWASPTAYHGSAKIVDTSGPIKEAIDLLILLATGQGITVTNTVSYCQYYKQSDTEPAIHRDLCTGFEPDFEPTHGAVLWISPHSNKFEFYLNEDGGDILMEKDMVENTMIIFNHAFAHRVKPASFGTDQSDSGLMLAVFMN